VYESQQEYQEELSRLSAELAKCTSDASQHEAVLNSLRLSSDEKISRLQEDKALLQVDVCVWSPFSTAQLKRAFLFSVLWLFLHSTRI